MNERLRVSYIRWSLAGALLACLYCAVHGALLLHFMGDTGGLSAFKPDSAEAVGRKAAPLQANTKETDGMFKLIQDQHRHLGIMFERLETADDLNWSLAVVGTAVFTVLSIVLAACLALLPKSPPASNRNAAGSHGPTA
jgi:hypothetical protein